MILKDKIYFIAGTGTDIGKTFLLEKICLQLKKKNIAFDAVKPVISGFTQGDVQSDSAKILQILDKEMNQSNFDDISPWRFEAPLSPNIAAKKENREIDFSQLVRFCEEKISQAKKLDQFLFIESAGGIMTPITGSKTFLDLAAQLNITVLLLTSNYLGAISHSLTALEALKSRNLLPELMVINDYPVNESLDIDDIIATIGNFSKIKTVPIEVFLD